MIKVANNFLKSLEEVVLKFQENKELLDVRVSDISKGKGLQGYDSIRITLIEEAALKTVYMYPYKAYLPELGMSESKQFQHLFNAPQTAFRLDFQYDNRAMYHATVKVYPLNSKFEAIKNIYPHVSHYSEDACMGYNLPHRTSLNLKDIDSDTLFKYILCTPQEFWSRGFKYEYVGTLSPQIRSILEKEYNISVSSTMGLLYKVGDKEIDWDLFPKNTRPGKLNYADRTVLSRVRKLIELSGAANGKEKEAKQ